jgi:hypothetical protein
VKQILGCHHLDHIEQQQSKVLEIMSNSEAHHSAQANSIKKHLGVESVSACWDINLLGKYITHLEENGIGSKAKVEFVMNQKVADYIHSSVADGMALDAVFKALEQKYTLSEENKKEVEFVATKTENTKS